MRVGGRTERKAGRTLQGGDVVLLDWRPSLLPCPELDAGCVIARGEGWLAVHKPPGLPTHRPSEEVPGVPERLALLLGGAVGDYRPAHRLDRATSGALLVALDDARASALSGAFEGGEVHKRYLAVVSPAPREERGERVDEGEDGVMELAWEVARRSADGSRAELAVCPKQGRTHQIRRQLAAAGTPVVGDLLYGTALASGTPRMALHCAQMRWGELEVRCAPAPGWDALLEPGVEPEAPRGARARKPQRAAKSEREVADARPARAPSPGRRLRTLTVSSATGRVLAGGHPWVLPDRDTGDLRGFAPGDQALLVDVRGRELGVALVDPSHSVVARLLDADGRAALTEQDLQARASKALKRRRDVLALADTDCGRLVNGEADGLPGLVVDRWGDALVITLACEAARALVGPVLPVLTERVGASRVYLKEHTVDLRRRGQGREGDELPGRWLVGGPSPADDKLIVREAGLRFRVEPFGGLTTGLYPDQRANRARLTRLITPDSRVANLFAHTAAFSVSAGAAGARTVSVDLSPRYTAWAAENLARNGLSEERHPCVAQSSETWLTETRERFDGVIIDPPAFARARKGDRGWSARRDYGGLVSRVAGVLDEGPAWVLCIINLKGVQASWFRQQIEQGLRRGGREVLSVERAGPARDYPTRKGFPEGVPFVGLLARVAPKDGGSRP